jgi:hypothetical protein
MDWNFLEEPVQKIGKRDVLVCGKEGIKGSPAVEQKASNSSLAIFEDP